ncbi:DUF3908 family protein [Paenibacillus sp. DMB5]|uniref:DUF3908 family protein n=1 Tax=Paenibacillus sp. DMB5 TaxID=1780103 RepID=UPI00076C0388|nr:DUF3908 family protein [Paenibacillus sp. DMB5]KUP25797.1 hypothetical protein AWJ19_19430 [Paenibacillus sp. DMB5]
MDEYNQFRNNFGGHYHFFDFVDKVVPQDKVKLFYPKFFFSDNPPFVELTIFSDNNIFIFTQSEEILEVSVIKDFKVKKLGYRKHSAHAVNAIIEISFVSGDELIFDANLDATENWQYHLSKIITRIFDTLSM